MNNQSVRVRFAPSPTGIMHLGNVRAALFNYLYAQQKNGTFVLRIEDTDPERNFDPNAQQIIKDLAWLNLPYTEGPGVGGPHAPYYQSQRTELYQEKLALLQDKGLVYRCFCSMEELAKKRDRQIALKQPPRYEKTCLKLSEQQIAELLATSSPFIWRLNISSFATATIKDLARGTVEFDLSHFSDFPVTRQNGTFTFMFANAIDDIMMEITHVMRGEDHLSNTANQVAIFQALNAPLPTFWHMPILCNTEGKKLSKRDFGFSLHDLINGGFLPEAINNYLGIIGGSFAEEIMPLDTLANVVNFDTMHAASGIKYDVEKLRWVNHKWIEKYTAEQLVERALPFLYAAYPQAEKLPINTITALLTAIKSELITLSDIKQAAAFFFTQPAVSHEELVSAVGDAAERTKLAAVLAKATTALPDAQAFLDVAKKEAQLEQLPMKKLFAGLRMILTHSVTGPRLVDIIALLPQEEVQNRLATGINLLG